MLGPKGRPRRERSGADIVCVRLIRAALAVLFVTIASAVVIGTVGCSSEGASQQTSTEDLSESAETPEEAELFMLEYGTRYEDPVSTYYASEAAKVSHETGFVITDSYLKTYAESPMNRREDGTPSELGFRLCSLPPGEDPDADTSLELFNSYTSQQLGLYMNLLAKNPTPDGIAAADKQFLDYCSDTEFDTIQDRAFHDDDTAIQTMMEIAKSVVAEYGSSANYTVCPAEFRTEDPAKSSFSPAKFNWSLSADGLPILFQGDASIVIAVDLYTGSSVSRRYRTVEHVNVIYMSQPLDHGSNSDGSPRLSVGLIPNN